MINVVLEQLASFWLFDMWVFSQWWLYAPLFVPFFAYLLFFVIKWWIITAPIHIPLQAILKGLNKK